MSDFVPNSFQIPNIVVDEYLPRFQQKHSFACLVYIIRKTKGWNKDSDVISVQSFLTHLNIKDKRTVRLAIGELEALGLIEVSRRSSDHLMNEYSLGAVFRSVGTKNAPTVGTKNAPTVGTKNAPTVGTKNAPLQTNNIQTNKIQNKTGAGDSAESPLGGVDETSPKSGTGKPKPEKFNALTCQPPDPVNPVAWREWAEYRRGKGKPISELAARKQFALLGQFGDDTQAVIVSTSIRNDWTGLFPPDRPSARASPPTQPDDFIARHTNPSWRDKFTENQPIHEG